MLRISKSRAIYWAIILTAALIGWLSYKFGMYVGEHRGLSPVIIGTVFLVMLFMSVPGILLTAIFPYTFPISLFNAFVWALITAWFLRKWRQHKAARRGPDAENSPS